MGFGYSGGTIEVENEKDFPERGRSGKPNALYYYYNSKGERVEVKTNANGEPIGQKSWTTIRNNYWEEVAKGPNAQQFESIAKGNIERMQQGKAPIGTDGKSMVLHHPYGREGNNINIVEEMTQSEHIGFHNENGYYYYYGQWHIAPYSSYLGGE